MNMIFKTVFIKSQLWVIPFVSIFIIAYYFILNYPWNDIISNVHFFEVLLVAQLFIYLIAKISLVGINEFLSKAFNNFLLMFALFHIGIPIAHAFGYSNDYFNEVTFWYYSQTTVQALMSVAIFLNAYFLSSIIDFKANFVQRVLKYSNIFFKINFIVLILAVITWVISIYFVLGLTEYQELYETNNLLFTVTFVYLTAIIGISFLIAILNQRVKYSIIVFLIWVLFAFNLGIRGPAFYPLALGAAILITNKVFKVSLLKFLLGIVILLSLLSYKFRERSNLEVSSYIDPLAAIQEMGGSLRPVYEVNHWLNIDNLDLYLGSTYLAPFDRTFNSLFRLHQNLPPELDNRLMNIVINDRAGPYGFSIVAEALVNFSTLGVILIGLVTGVFFKWFDYNSKAALTSPFLMVFAYGFFYHIRQAFVSTYGVVVIGLIYVVLLLVMAKLLRQSSFK